MATVFRDVATLPDSTGRYRACLILATRRYGGTWSDKAIADYIARAPRPTKALEVTDSEWERLEAGGAAVRLGYVDAPGDLESPIDFHDWSAR